MCKWLLFAVFIPGLLVGSTILTFSGPPTARAGTSIVLTLSTSGVTDAGAAGLEWLVAPASGFILTGNAVGSAATAVYKSLTCTANSTLCILTANLNAVNANIIGNGPIATFNVAVPSSTAIGPYSFQLSNALGVDPTGVGFNPTFGPAYVLSVVAPTAAPVITTTSPLPAGTQGAVYSQVLTTVNGTSPVTCLLAGGTLSGSGLALSHDCTITGTGGTPATYSLAVTPIDANSISGTPVVFSLTINPAIVLQAPVITSTTPLPGAVIGVVYSYQFAATGSMPVVWSGTGLPPWGTLTSGGLFTGTPTAVANYTLLVKATNSVGLAGPYPFALSVKNKSRGTQISGSSIQ